MCQQAAAVPGLEDAPAAEARWTGENGWDGSRSTGASQGPEPTLFKERMGAQHWFSLEKGIPMAPCKYLVGEEEESLSQLCTWTHSVQGLGKTIPLPSKLVGVHDYKSAEADSAGVLRQGKSSISIPTGYPQEPNF